MKRSKPPFRADHVGSLLRPQLLKDVRAKRERGEIDAAALKAVEDRCISDVIDKQEEVGPAKHHRRRVPPLVLALRLPGRHRRGRDFHAGEGAGLQGRDAAPDLAAAHRQGRRLLGPPDARALQVRADQHQTHAEDDDPGAVGAAFPRRARNGERENLPRHGRILSRSRPGLPQGGEGVRRRRLPLPAARRGLSRLSVRSGIARVRAQARRGSRTS